MTFKAIDVETANADRATICQIGIVHVEEGEIVDRWETLIDPEDWFDPWNVSIHGIDEIDVNNSPTLPQVRNELRRRLRGSALVSHTSFDRVAFERAMDRYGLERLQVTWLDSAGIARRAWPEKYGPRVTSQVTMLVVGTQDKTKLNGYEKSSKHRKAEALVMKGMEIQILSESDFSELIGVDLRRRHENGVAGPSAANPVLRAAKFAGRFRAAYSL